jgi:hypothetical protein
MTADSRQRRPSASLLHGLALILFLSTGAAGDSARVRPHGAPEIDSSLWNAGLVVIVGGTLWLTGNRRKTSR